MGEIERPWAGRAGCVHARLRAWMAIPGGVHTWPCTRRPGWVRAYHGLAQRTAIAFTEASARCQSTRETATRIGDTQRTLTSASGAAASTASRTVLSSCPPPSQDVDSSTTNVGRAEARRSLRLCRGARWMFGRRLAARSPAHAIPGRRSPAAESAPAHDSTVSGRATHPGECLCRAQLAVLTSRRTASGAHPLLARGHAACSRSHGLHTHGGEHLAASRAAGANSAPS